MLGSWEAYRRVYNYDFGVFSMLLLKNMLNVLTVYQRTPNIAISEVWEILHGHDTGSVFLEFSLVFCEFSVKACVSDFADILMYIYDYNK